MLFAPVHCSSIMRPLTAGLSCTVSNPHVAVSDSLEALAPPPGWSYPHPDTRAPCCRAILHLLKEDIKPRDIMTRAAFENAMVIIMALGGSTNAVLHLLAMAHAVGACLLNCNCAPLLETWTWSYRRRWCAWRTWTRRSGREEGPSWDGTGTRCTCQIKYFQQIEPGDVRQTLNNQAGCLHGRRRTDFVRLHRFRELPCRLALSAGSCRQTCITSTLHPM
jgi:Dehydratase family